MDWNACSDSTVMALKENLEQSYTKIFKQKLLKTMKMVIFLFKNIY